MCLALPGIAHAQDPTPADFAAAQRAAPQGRGGGGFRGGFGGASFVALSPDGTRIAWVGPPAEGTGRPGLWVMPLAGGAATHLGAGVEREVSWSPDGQSFACISGRGGEVQIEIIPAAGGEPKPVTTFKGETTGLAWSPDGRSLAFLGIENPSRVSGATQPFKPQTGVVGSKPDVKRLAVVDVSTGELRWASPPEMYVYEFGWAPSSKEIAVTAAAPPGENNWWTAKLYAADVSTGKLRLITTPDLQINDPRWSPDGQTIAYIGGLMSDFGSIGGDVYTVPAAGGKPVDVTPGHKGSANSLEWLHDGTLVFGEAIDGVSGIEKVNPKTGKIELLVKGPISVTGPSGRNTISVSDDGRTQAYAMASETHGNQIYLGSFDSPKQLTHWTEPTRAAGPKVQSLHWKSGKFTVQGWLTWPDNYQPGKKYPMIVNVHGGPAAAVTGGPGFGQGSMWTRNGYFVLQPNPRGSYGQGEEFTKANRKDFGYGDFRDIMAGVDEAIKEAPVDPNRLGLTGGSYGGYMTMWGVTQTHRFKAAVAVAGISDWLSYYGENSIDQWMIPFFGATVYDDPKVYAKSSPITFIKNVKTPTLVVVGEYDGECPPPQSYEFWHALNVLGVKTELLVYPGEGHGIRQPENARDLSVRELAWFNYFLK